MSLLREGAASESTGETPQLEAVPSPTSTSSGEPGAVVALRETETVAWDGETQVEALAIDSLITSTRFHRHEATTRGMPDWQAQMHITQVMKHAVVLEAEYGMDINTIPTGTLKH